MYFLGFSLFYLFSPKEVIVQDTLVVEEDYIKIYKDLYAVRLDYAESDYHEPIEMIKRGEGRKKTNIKDELGESSIAVATEKVYEKDGKKVAFLTFDDGPSANITPRILDILDKYNIKATFFVIGFMAEENKEILKRAYNSGHAIANHSYTHNYNKVYGGIQNFTEEIDRANNTLREILGYNFETRVFRFPGGAFDTRNQYKEVIKNKNMVYIDWNSLNGDAEGQNLSAERLINRFKETFAHQEKLVVLMHDAPAKKTTADSLSAIIDFLKNQGYEFGVLR